jgi:hypothetical protein
MRKHLRRIVRVAAIATVPSFLGDDTALSTGGPNELHSLARSFDCRRHVCSKRSRADQRRLDASNRAALRADLVRGGRGHTTSSIPLGQIYILRTRYTDDAVSLLTGAVLVAVIALIVWTLADRSADADLPDKPIT